MTDHDPNPQTAADDTNPLHYGSTQHGKLVQTPAQKAAAGPQPEPKTVAMDILRDGSYDGVYHHVGDTIDVPDDHVETLTLSGFAARADRAEVAQQARDTAARRAEADRAAAAKRGGKRSTAVAPLTTHAIPGAEPSPSSEPPQQ